MSTPNFYTESFFANRLAGSLSSGRRVVPYLKELIDCHSVIDVGCGIGTWLAAFRENGISDVLGVDGNYIIEDQLLIPRNLFVATDLTSPLKIDRTFELAMSLEVAEHLQPEGNESFVKMLTTLSPVVLFSASVPFQDGTNHINEHWTEYWVDLFQQNNFVPIDCLRSKFWNDPEVDWWYAQNALVYVSEQKLAQYPRLEALANFSVAPTTRVHPKLLIYKEQRLVESQSFKTVWKTAIEKSMKVAKDRIGRLIG